MNPRTRTRAVLIASLLATAGCAASALAFQDQQPTQDQSQSQPDQPAAATPAGAVDAPLEQAQP